MIIIPPSLFASPLRKGGVGASSPESPWDALLFFAVFAVPLACLFGYMWYDLEYNIKPAEAKAEAGGRARFAESGRMSASQAVMSCKTGPNNGAGTTRAVQPTTASWSLTAWPSRDRRGADQAA